MTFIDTLNKEKKRFKYNFSSFRRKNTHNTRARTSSGLKLSIVKITAQQKGCATPQARLTVVVLVAAAAAARTRRRITTQRNVFRRANRNTGNARDRRAKEHQPYVFFFFFTSRQILTHRSFIFLSLSLSLSATQFTNSRKRCRNTASVPSSLKYTGKKARTRVSSHPRFGR